MAINMSSGFNITAKEAVDARIIKTKEQMLNMTTLEKARMPDKYFCMCSDDGQIYFFDKDATPSATTGLFKPLDETVADDIKNKAAVQDSIAKAIEDNESIKAKIDDSVQASMSSGTIEVPIASTTLQGSVTSSTDKNKVSVDSTTGAMEVNELGVEKLSNTEGIILVLNGGKAPTV